MLMSRYMRSLELIKLSNNKSSGEPVQTLRLARACIGHGHIHKVWM